MNSVSAQLEPINDRPNPFSSVDGWANLPGDRTWGSTAGVDIDPDGRHLWAIDRCGSNTCAGSNLDPIVKIDPNGNVVAAIGGGLMLFPHGLHVDRDGNIWVTDGQGPNPDNPATAGKGHVVYKLSPEGQVLMTLGQLLWAKKLWGGGAALLWAYLLAFNSTVLDLAPLVMIEFWLLHFAGFFVLAWCQALRHDNVKNWCVVGVFLGLCLLSKGTAIIFHHAANHFWPRVECAVLVQVCLRTTSTEARLRCTVDNF